MVDNTGTPEHVNTSTGLTDVYTCTRCHSGVIVLLLLQAPL